MYLVSYVMELITTSQFSCYIYEAIEFENIKAQLDQFFPLVDSSDVYIGEIIEIFSSHEKAMPLNFQRLKCLS